MISRGPMVSSLRFDITSRFRPSPQYFACTDALDFRKVDGVAA